LVIDISKQVAPHFHETFNSLIVHQIDSGGRGSTKTSKNALKVVNHMISDKDCNVVAIRRHKNTLRQSVYAEIKRAFKRLGMKENIHFKATVSPMKITYLGNGNTIYFGGLDDSDKLKGMIADEGQDQIESDVPKFKNVQDMLDLFIETGEDDSEEIDSANIKIVWLSEITEIKEEEDILQTVATFSRGDKDYFIVLYEYNPPKNKFHWVNKWTEQMSKRPDAQVTHSSYLTVPKKWLGPIFIQQAEQLKINDEDRYNHIYLGMATGIDGIIYNSDLIEVVECLEDSEYIIDIDIYIDTGHQTSATPFLCVGNTSRGKTVLLDTYYYSPNGKTVKKAPSEFSEDLWNFTQYCCNTYKASQDTMIIDSAEGGMRNQFFKDYGIRLTPVSKVLKTTMIDYVQDLLSFKKLYVINNANNKIFLIEHRNYEWLEGSVEKGKPEPDKREKKLAEKYYNTHSESWAYFYGDHTCDCLQYGVKMNLSKYNLQF